MKNKGGKNKTFVFPLILLVLGMMLYANTINHDYVWDDSIVITSNPHTQRGLDALGEIWTKPTYIVERPIYRPVTQTTFALEKAIYPEGNPFFGHGINVFLYGLSCMLIFIFLRGILSNYHVYFSFFSALLFTVHPLHTEVVANIKSRDEILALLFSLLSLILFKKFVANRKLKNLITPLLLFITAILSKGNAITILAIYPLVYFFHKYNDKKIKSNYNFSVKKEDFTESFSWFTDQIGKSWIPKVLFLLFLVIAVFFNSHPLALIGIIISAIYVYFKGELGEGADFHLGSAGMLMLSLFFGLQFTLFAAICFYLLYPVINRKWNMKNVLLPALIIIPFILFVGKIHYSFAFFVISLYSYLQFYENKKNSFSHIIPLGIAAVSFVVGSPFMGLIFLMSFLLAYLKWSIKLKNIFIGSLLVISIVGATELYFSQTRGSIAVEVAMNSFNNEESIVEASKDTINWGDDKLELSPLNNTISQISNNRDRQATIAYVNLLYLYKSFYPHPLIHNYGINVIPNQSFRNFGPWLSIFIFTLLLLYAFIKIRKNDPIAFGILWFIITLSIYSHVVALAPDTLAERFLYFPSVGFCTLFVFGLSAILKIDFSKGLLANSKNILFTSTILILSGLAIYQTLDRNKDWENNRILVTETLSNAPSSSLLHITYSTEWYRYYTEIAPASAANFTSAVTPAITAAEKAIEIHPEYFYAMNHLGEMYLSIGELDKAKAIYNKALGVNDKHIVPSFKLGLVHYSLNEFQEAVDFMQPTLDFYGDRLNNVLSYDDVDRFHLFLARCYFKLGDMDNAIATVERATLNQPNNPHYYDLLSSMFLNLGNQDEALEALEKASAINPNDDTVSGKLHDLKQRMEAQ